MIIHATHTQDIREMGGLRKRMPWTATTFVIGALALSGVFPFSGFWSKDDILTTLFRGRALYLGRSPSALLVAGITAFYMTRLCVRVFGGNEHAASRTRATPSCSRRWSLLAAITAVIGFGSAAFARLPRRGAAVAVTRRDGARQLGRRARRHRASAWWVYALPGASTPTT